MSIITNLEKEIKESIKNAGYELDNFSLQLSSRPDLGDYQINDAMTLARTYHKNPHQIAEDIKNELEKSPKFTNINIAGPGFINISLKDEYLVDLLNMIKEDINSLIDKKEPKSIVLDYGGANVAKALHVGHLRSANIGEAIKRLATLLGYNVLGDAHLGDYGRPLGFVVLEIKKRYPDLPYFDESYNGDYSEEELPITKEISKKDIKKVYDELNVHFELWQGESDAAEYFNELNAIFEKKNLLEESEGAKIVEVKEETDKAPMPPLLFVKSNGTISYATTDLATILERQKKHHPDEIWYCTDARQELHFTQVFRAARKAELVTENQKLDWFGFGTMNGSDGKPFKTRDGGVMSLKGLIDLVNEETLKRINPDTVPEEEREKISRIIAIATLKYADLIPYRGTDYIFEVEKFADLEGKTGPYLLYSTIRMKSLLAKAKDIKQETAQVVSTKTEKDIILTILNLTNILNKSLEAKSLNDIAEYLYKLTSQYNKFYAENKIITEEDAVKRESWLVLTKIVYNINMLLLDVLGIPVPEKM